MNKRKAEELASEIILNLDGKSLVETLVLIEAQAITRVLKTCNGNCAEAADLLNMNRTTLVEKRKKFGLPMMPARQRRETLSQ